MTTPTGTITMLDVIEELDGTPTPRQITLNDADVRGLAGVPSGEISMDDLRGKSAKHFLATGFITVGDSGNSQYGYIGVGSPMAGSVRDVVFYNEWSVITNLNFLYNVTTSDYIEGQGNAFVPPPRNLRAWGHGKDVTSVLNAGFNLGGVTTFFNDNAPVNVLFGPADVGLEFEFEMWIP